MELYKIMEEYGFKKSSSCSGFEWYTKSTKYNSVDALITITSNDEPRLPESLDEPVLVDITDRNSGIDTLDPVS
ncbi:MAG: hypothetical protein JRE10_08365 [Deltaproteobacteria bacterium]|nr:hypothetical protein [Deltaproteobacteria bacterium]